MSRMLVLVVLAAFALLAACGDDDDVDGPPENGGTTPAATEPAEPADGEQDADDQQDGSDEEGDGSLADLPETAGDGCVATVSGDVEQEISGPSNVSSVGASYWLSEEQQESLGSEELFLILNCGTTGDVISLLPTTGTTEDDVPFGPGEYVISGDGLEGEPGEFGLLMSLGERLFSTDGEGTLDITKFDGTGIAGSFSFDAVEFLPEDEPARIHVEGTFDYGCIGDRCD